MPTLLCRISTESSMQSESEPDVCQFLSLEAEVADDTDGEEGDEGDLGNHYHSA